jgi:2,3-bisphosphoglycerate-independent phosphoglycerate mutase
MNGPFLLVVIDGFGLASAGDGNAISLARTPMFDRLFETCPWTALEASGLEVGLPAGIMGNSEVGHLNIGAGRVVPQDIVRIDAAISDGSFVDNTTLRAAVDHAVQSGGRLHLMGLYSDGNVHACDAHVRALVDVAARDLPADRVLLHVITDGRDTPPRSADRYVAELVGFCRGKATIATVVGRFYAMDRDKRWERTERAYRAIVGGQGLSAPDALAAIAAAYDRGEGDEFIQPTVLAGVGDRAPLIRPDDAAFFWNYRADRARQMCSALVDPDFDGFDREDLFPRGLHLASMTQYTAGQPYRSAFAPQQHTDLIADVWSREGLSQLRIAETEKYAHVTYFFNGGDEKQLPGEHRVLVPSPRVETYDLQPEMSAPEVTEKLLAEIEGGTFDAGVLNLANPDMVGHTGVIPATIQAVEVVDRCVGRLAEAVLARGGTIAVTADHGNAEQMLDQSTGQPHTAHTTNPVPLIVCGAPQGTQLAATGRLADVAPTVLALMGLLQPERMSGRNLVLST